MGAGGFGWCLQCTVQHCPVIAMVITPLFPFHSSSPLCGAMCTFNSDWGGAGGRDKVCVCACVCLVSACVYVECVWDSLTG